MLTNTHDMIETLFEKSDRGQGDSYKSYPYPRKIEEAVSWHLEVRPISKIFPVYRFRYPTWINIKDENGDKLVPSSQTLNLSKPAYVILEDGQYKLDINEEGRTTGEVKLLKFYAEIMEAEYSRIASKLKGQKEDHIGKEVNDFSLDKFGFDAKVYGSFCVVNNKVQPLDIKSLTFNPQSVKKFRTPDFEAGLLQHLTKVDGGKVKHPFFLTSFVLSGMKSSQKSKQGGEYAVYEPRPMNLGDDTPLLDQVFACQLNKRGELVPPVICHPADKDELIAYLLEIRDPSKKPDEIRAIKRPNYKAYPDPDSGHVVLISQVGSIAGVEVDLWKGSRREFFPSAMLKELASERNFYNYKPSTALSLFGGFRVIVDDEWIEISREQLKGDYAGQNEGKHYLKFDGQEVEVDYYHGLLQQHPLDPDLPKSELDETAIYSDNVRKNIRRFAGEYGIPLHGEFQKDDNPFGFLTGKTEVKAVDSRGELPFETDEPKTGQKNRIPDFATV